MTFYSKLQAEDGHWTGDYGGPLFLMAGTYKLLYSYSLEGVHVCCGHFMDLSETGFGIISRCIIELEWLIVMFILFVY